MKLATTLLVAPSAEPRRTMLFLHGLLGTRANWRGLARRFVEARPDWAALLVDLREHGESLGMPGPDTIDQCALDLGTLDPPAEIRGALGHSFGGKVAMRWAEQRGRDVDELYVVDASPSARPGRAGEVRVVLSLLREAQAAAPEGFEDREAFTRFIVDRGEPRAIADWLAMNLGALPNGRRGLRLDLDRIERLLASHLETDTWAALESAPGIGETHVLLGGRSQALDDEDRARLRRIRETGRNIVIHIAPNAGHWVHVDAPELVLGVLAKKLTDMSV